MPGYYCRSDLKPKKRKEERGFNHRNDGPHSVMRDDFSSIFRGNVVMNKWKRLPIGVKASIAFFLATVLTKGITFLSTPIFTRLMNESDMGSVGTYSSWKGIYITISNLSLTSAGVINVGLANRNKDRDKYLSSVVGFCIIWSSIVGVIMLVLRPILNKYLQLPDTLYVLLILHAVFTPPTTFWIIKERYEFHYKGVFIVTVLQVLIGQLVSILAVDLNSSHLDIIRVMSVAAIEYPIGLFFAIYLIFKGRGFYNRLTWKETLLFSLPLIPHYLSSVVLTGSDRIMISQLDSQSSAGIYTVVYGVGSIGTIIWGAIQGSVTPTIYDRMSNHSNDGVNQLCLKLILIFGCACLSISLLAPEVIRILGPRSYLKGVYVVPPVVGAILISCLYNLFSIVTFYYKKSGFIAFASIVAAAINIILNYILIPRFGFVAAAYTTLVSYIVLAIMHFIIMKKTQEFEVYNGGQLFGICTVLLLLCITVSLIYEYCWMRYAIISMLIIIGMINRKTILQLFWKR